MQLFWEKIRNTIYSCRSLLTVMEKDNIEANNCLGYKNN